MRFTWIRSSVAAVLCCFLFVGCDSNEQAVVEPTGTVATATPESTHIVVDRQSSDIKVLDIAAPVESLSYDVHRSFSASLHRVGPGLVYSRLLRFNSDVQSPDLVGLLECDLCSKWEQIDQTTYRFTLRDSVKWHNIAPLEGRLITVEDVIHSYQRQQTEGWPNSGLLRNISDMVKVSASVLEIQTYVPDADFVLSLAAGHSKILPVEVNSRYEDVISKGPIGTGPWVFVRQPSVDGYVLESNPFYYEAGLPKMDVLRIKVIPDQTVRFASMAVGGVDFVDLTSEQVDTLKSRSEQFGVMTVPNHGFGIDFVLNTDQAPLDSLESRQSIFRAIDPWKYAELHWPKRTFNGLGFPARHESWYMNQEELAEYVGHSGQTIMSRPDFDFSGTEVTLSVGDYGVNFSNLAEEITKDLVPLGMSIDVERIAVPEYVKMTEGKRSYDMYLGPSVPLNMPNQYFFGVLHSEGRYNSANYGDAGMDLLIELQGQEMDPLSRTKIIREINQRGMHAATRLMLATDNLHWGWDGKLRGVSINPTAQEYFYYAYFVWADQR